VNAGLDRLLAAQLGLVTRQQALDGGMSRRQINRLLGTAWAVALPAVYRHRSFPETWNQRLLAATLKAGEGSAVSHRAAVGLHGLRGFKCDMVELTRPAPEYFPIPGAVVHRYTDLRPEDVVTIGGVPVTSPARTLVDLGAVARPYLLHRCLEEWTARRSVRIPQVVDAITVYDTPGRRGVHMLQRVMDARVLRDLEPDSVDEGLLGEVLVRHGLRLPELHHVVVLESGLVYELDWSYPDLRVAFELDGYGVHLVSLEAFVNDRDRRNELLIAGWRILQFATKTVRQHPRRVVSQVQRLLAESASQG
jgi:very-short-patch-repair endonuclease